MMNNLPALVEKRQCKSKRKYKKEVFFTLDILIMKEQKGITKWQLQDSVKRIF